MFKPWGSRKKAKTLGQIFTQHFVCYFCPLSLPAHVAVLENHSQSWLSMQQKASLPPAEKQKKGQKGAPFLVPFSTWLMAPSKLTERSNFPIDQSLREPFFRAQRKRYFSNEEFRGMNSFAHFRLLENRNFVIANHCNDCRVGFAPHFAIPVIATRSIDIGSLASFFFFVSCQRTNFAFCSSPEPRRSRRHHLFLSLFWHRLCV